MVPETPPVPPETPPLPPATPRVPRRRSPRLIRPVAAPATVPPPLTGDWAPDDRRLDDVEVFPLPAGVGPEDVAVDPDGGVVTGAEDGRIWRWPGGARPGDHPAPVADTGGRPLGVEVDPRDGSLLVCDAWRGLLRVTADGTVTDLTDAAAGRPFGFCNNATVARDGTVYLTDSSDRYTVHTWKRDLLEHRPNGRVVAWSPSSGRTEVVADGLLFPNGLALTPDESALVVAEMGQHRVVRIALAGGDPVVLTDLPAYPDNLSAVGDGTYWVALPSPRVAIAERLLPYPRLRQVVALLPDRLQPRPLRYGLAVLLDAEGRVLRTLHGPAGRYAMVTGVRQQGDALWLGSLTERSIARTRL